MLSGEEVKKQGVSTMYHPNFTITNKLVKRIGKGRAIYYELA